MIVELLEEENSTLKRLGIFVGWCSARTWKRHFEASRKTIGDVLGTPSGSCSAVFHGTGILPL